MWALPAIFSRKPIRARWQSPLPQMRIARDPRGKLIQKQHPTHLPNARTRSLLDDDTRYRLLRLLTKHPELTQRELASELGMSLGKTNYCLRALIGRGWIKVQNFRNSDNKLAYAYVLTPSGVTAKLRATADFLRRKQKEFVRLEQEIAQLRMEVESAATTATEDSSSAT